MEEELIVSQKEALEKYQNIKHNDDGTCTVRVRYQKDGSIDPSSYNMNYRNKLKAQDKKNEDTSDSDSSDSENDPLWVRVVFTIIPFLLIWWIIKAILALILWPFRCIFCCNCNYPTPSYNFSRW